MITAKNAVRRALDFLSDVVSETPSAMSSVRVEEVYQDPDSQIWHVSLSYLPVTDGEVQSAELSGRIQQVEAQRIFRAFAVDVETGEVTSMKRLAQASGSLFGQ